MLNLTYIERLAFIDMMGYVTGLQLTSIKHNDETIEYELQWTDVKLTIALNFEYDQVNVRSINDLYEHNLLLYLEQV